MIFCLKRVKTSSKQGKKGAVKRGRNLVDFFAGVNSIRHMWCM